MLLLAASAVVTLVAPTVVFGPGASVEMKLITAKLAARAGYDACVFQGEGAEGASRWLKLLYGTEYAKRGEDVVGNARVLEDLEAMGRALKTAQTLCLICDESPLADSQKATLLSRGTSPNLQRVVLVSRMGVTRAKPAPFGLPSSDMALREAEEALQRAASERDLELSIVRVGTLKGGGPGAVENGIVTSGVELGLSKQYYDGITELETYLVTAAYDKFTLGCKLSAGDPFDMPNGLMRATKRGSFDPSDVETSRIVVGGAIVHALSHPATVELTVSAARGEAPPAADEWEELFHQATGQ
jgi:hypothetical protein